MSDFDIPVSEECNIPLKFVYFLFISSHDYELSHMVIRLCSYWTEESWVSRSLFVTGVHLLVCVEDLMQFGSLSEEASSSPYFSLDAYCSINDISEMVTLSFTKPFLSLINTIKLCEKTRLQHLGGEAGFEERVGEVVWRWDAPELL